MWSWASVSQLHYDKDPPWWVNDFLYEKEFDAWISPDEDEDGVSTDASNNVEERPLPKTYTWDELNEIQVLLAKYRELLDNKAETVRWFRANLPGSVFAHILIMQ
ncbi:hypothetical protein CYMTET_55826 [Cymbomonas tetramitiformis]|uniref:Uncharacterized protein n=1 Tax=Cymbomonas tetramitiformis TaxID=36881 RepID=A0AAE0BCI6_9CHLO|nr:hypothetical protein CYMTET_55826 [Cymbomonas tetramitiformis]